VLTTNTQFEQKLKKRIAEYQSHLGEILFSGKGIENYAQYQNYIGQIAALDRVCSEFCDDVNTEINKER
jgi:hypothetical protein